MSVYAGGLEGAQVLSERVGNRIYAAGTATAGDLTLLLITAVSSEAYILGTLSEDRLSSPQTLLGRGGSGILKDPVQYTLGLTGERLARPIFVEGDLTRFFDDIHSNGRSLRRRSLLNLLDYEHVTTSVGFFRDHLWRGERKVPVRWLHVGALSLVPAVSYRLSPVGPELQVKTRYKRGNGVGRLYVRWTERVRSEDSRLIGAGGEFARVSRGRFAAQAGFDVWRNPDDTKSVRGEIAATFSRSADDRLVFSAAIGGKGRGDVLGYPMASGAFFSLGAGMRF